MSKYKVKYNVKYNPEGFDAEELRQEGWGGCENLVLLPVMGIPGGNTGLDVVAITFSDTNGDIPPTQLFPIWVTWTNILAEIMPEGGRKQFLKQCVDTVKKAINVTISESEKVNEN